MSRYTGPRLKVVRALGTALPGLTSKTTERNYPPCQHGQRQRKKSDYGIKLMEKQKLRFNYGVTETQIRRLMSEAKASRDQAGKKLLEFLERRIDNAVFRAGFAPTIVAARQLVRHKHAAVERPRREYSVDPRQGRRHAASDGQGLEDSLCHRNLGDARAGGRRVGEARRDERHRHRAGVIPTRAKCRFRLRSQHVVEYYAVRL